MEKEETALKWNRWNSSEIVMLFKNASAYQKEYLSNNWGLRKDNPYSNFYETAEEFEKYLEFINKLRKTLEKQKSSTTTILSS